MIKRVKFLIVVFLGCVGLSGCVLVDDEFATYASYPSGSYAATVDYYHRPPRHYISNHKHKTTVHKKDYHLDKPKHIEKPELPKRIDKPKTPKHINKPEPQVIKIKHPIKEKAPDVSQHHAPKQDVIKKPEPVNEPLHKITVQDFSNSKNGHIKKPKPQIHRHK